MADVCKFPELIPDFVTYVELAIAIVITTIFTIIGYNHDSVLYNVVQDDKDDNISMKIQNSKRPKQHQQTGKNNNNPKTCKNTCFSFAKCLYQKYGAYSLLAAHIFDQASDLGVITQFAMMAFSETNNKCKNVFTDEEINFGGFFYATLSSFFFYRFISGFWILAITKLNMVRGISQILFDFEIYRTIYITWILDLDHECEPQKIMQLLETIFESV
eukprot:373029_1